MLRLQPSFGGSVEASHPHVKDHTTMIVRTASASKIAMGFRPWAHRAELRHG